MGCDREELEDERRGIVQWLLDVAFGRRDDADNAEGEKVHRVGTINRLLKED